ncbi:GNAT family N-acetyltransferase [Nocardioides sp. zg-DK7169]|uniref:GNAT family N-acetyltransferase n=1 Tax=Nocardioides sp. zg-DK7169 TaxID=2736600 RepID=UPI001557E553|nr:GNAT family N-acetyltransferase [Nocardioides sp. zg-DK7169]NPC98429.1 GNAT family N-acetyltransferase [Nocardioides sp. zg-DK7169]
MADHPSPADAARARPQRLDVPPEERPGVRAAAPRDLRRLAPLEAAADAVLLAALGVEPADAGWGEPVDGRDRDLRPGFLLVAGDPPIGFAHVQVIDGDAHLEQLAVHPDHARRGLGTALVRAALEEARWAGHERLSLTTYREVAFNEPFYRRLGFTEVERPSGWQRRLVVEERERGLERAGARILLDIALGGQARNA